MDYWKITRNVEGEITNLVHRPADMGDGTSAHVYGPGPIALPAVVSVDFDDHRMPIKVNDRGGGPLLALNPGAARWLGNRLIEAAVLAEVEAP